jgi:DNA-binding NtrC family response regulator
LDVNHLSTNFTEEPFFLDFSSSFYNRFVCIVLKLKEAVEAFGLDLSTRTERDFVMGISIDSSHIRKIGPFTGQSRKLRQVYDQIRKAALIDISILLQGETGTGKDLAAQTIHCLSDRSEGPFIPVNLGALPSEMVASELFGHEKGSFTGAIAQRKGKFEQAKNGTIFLDEIESIDENVQVSLLRLVDEKKFYRLGGKRRVTTNARLTVASNEHLESLVEQGTFREDLFYRLHVFPIYLPPLRERKEDISYLATEFTARQSRILKKQITRISPEGLRMLEDYDWPGNVRELKNIIQRAVLLCDGEELRPEHFPARLRTAETPSALPVISFNIGTPLEEVERALIQHTLEAVDNNRTEAAKLLGISRRALYNRLRKYQIA